MLDHVLDHLQFCSLNEIRDNGREMQKAMKPCIEHLHKCAHKYQHAEGPQYEVSRLGQDVIESDNEIVGFLFRAVDAIHSQGEQILHDLKMANTADRTAVWSIKIDSAMVDKAKLTTLRNWLRTQVSTQAAAARLHPMTSTPSSSRINRITTHNRNYLPGARQYGQTSRNRPHLLFSGHSAGISTAILRASGRHHTRTPLNSQLDDILDTKRMQKHTRGYKKPESSLAKRQNEVAEKMVEWWKARDEMEEARKKEVEEKQKQKQETVDEQSQAKKAT